MISVYDYVYREKGICNVCGKPQLEWIPIMDAVVIVPEDFLEKYCECEDE